MVKHTIITLILIFISCGLFAQDYGNATYYSSKLAGRKTTDGSRYNPDSMTCAHKTYPLGTYLLVINPANNQRVIVKVTDRGPFNRHLMIDLSYAAAKKLDIVRKGIAPVLVIETDMRLESLIYMPVKQYYLKIKEVQAIPLILLKTIK